ncbi:UNVERIFIED_CONTAM: hypothetical protein K2H54_022812 [Gekko kuhli]
MEMGEGKYFPGWKCPPCCTALCPAEEARRLEALRWPRSARSSRRSKEQPPRLPTAKAAPQNGQNEFPKGRRQRLGAPRSFATLTAPERPSQAPKRRKTRDRVAAAPSPNVLGARIGETIPNVIRDGPYEETPGEKSEKRKKDPVAGSSFPNLAAQFCKQLSLHTNKLVPLTQGRTVRCSLAVLSQRGT